MPACKRPTLRTCSPNMPSGHARLDTGVARATLGGADVDKRFKLDSPWAQALRKAAQDPEGSQQQVLHKDEEVRAAWGGLGKEGYGRGRARTRASMGRVRERAGGQGRVSVVGSMGRCFSV